MKNLELTQMENLQGGHLTPGQCSAMAVAAVVSGVLLGPLGGFMAAVGVGIACADV